MHLNGQLFLGEDEFHENREVFAGSEAGASPLGGHLAPRRAQRLPLKWACRDSAIDAGEPGFAKWLGPGWFFRVGRPRRTPAPQRPASNPPPPYLLPARR